MPASVGLLMPVALALGSIFWGDDRLLLATCLLPYLETLLSQIWMESYFTKQGRPLLPVPCILQSIFLISHDITTIGMPGMQILKGCCCAVDHWNWKSCFA